MKKLFILLLLATVACEAPKTDGETSDYIIVQHAYGIDTIEAEVCLIESRPLRGVYRFYTDDSIIAVYPWVLGSQPPIIKKNQ